MADEYLPIPQAAIDGLVADPTLAQPFNSIFGEGAAERVFSETSDLPTAPRRPEDDIPALGFFGTAWDVTGRAVGYGVQEAINETANAFESLDHYLSEMGDRNGIPTRLSFINDEGEWQFQLQTLAESREEPDFFGGTVGERGDNFQLEMVQAPETGTGRFVGGLAQFAAGLVGAGKVTRLGGLYGAFVNGAIADAVVFNPNDPNIARVMEEFGVDMGPLTDLLATDPEDPEFVNRLRNAGEGAVVGGIVEALFWGARAARLRATGGDSEAIEAATEAATAALRTLDAEVVNGLRAVAEDGAETIRMTEELLYPVADALDENAEAFLRQLEVPPSIREAEADAQIVRSPEEIARLADEAVTIGDPLVPAGALEQARLRAAETGPVPNRIYMTQRQIDEVALQTRLAADAPLTAVLRDTSFRSINSQNTVQGIANEIGGTVAVLADQFRAIKNGDVQTWRGQVLPQVMRRLRQMAEVHGRDPEELIRRFATANNGDMANMAAEISAQMAYIGGVEMQLRNIGRAVREGLDGKPVNYQQFGVNNLDELRLHYNVQSEIGANLLAFGNANRSNAGRALRALRLYNQNAEGLREVLSDPLLFRNIDASARLVADAADKSPNSSSLRIINESMGWLKEAADDVNTFRINALLSGPGTQEVNFISNALNGLYIPVSQIAGGIAAADRRMVVHGIRTLQGTFASFFDSARMALDTFYRNEANLDFMNKIEEDNFSRAETAMGTIMRLPSRTLMAMDEFFKQSQYRGRIMADANEMARTQGLRGAERTEFMQNYIRESFDDAGMATRQDALLQARRSTFTEPLEGGVGAAIQRAAIEHPIVRFVVPFVRTPINILSQTFQHAPILGMASKRMRADFAAGGVRAAQARGRQMTGFALTGMAGYMAASGFITGSGPSDPRLRAAWLANNQPYSFKIHHEDGRVQFISYARLEPLSNVFSIAADMVDIMNNEYGENEIIPAQQAMLMAVMENTVNKTFTQGIYDTMQMMVGRPHEQARAASNMVASFVPNILNQTNGDMALREARTVMDNIQTRLPAYHNSVDPRRNIMGEVVVRPLPKYDPLGLANWDIREVDTVMEEVTQQGFLTQSVSGAPTRRLPGPNRIDLGRVPYSDTQSVYDRWLELTGTVEIGGRTLRQQLEHVISQDFYQNAPEGDLNIRSGGTKGTIIRDIITDYRQAARAAFPELQELIRAEEMGTSRLLLEQSRSNRAGNRFPSVDIILNPTESAPETAPQRPRSLADMLLGDQ